MSDARAIYKEGFEHFLGRRPEQAVACYRRALELDPRLAIAWSALARALGDLGQLDPAIEAAQRLIELEPEEPLGHTTLSILYQRKGMIAEAEEEKAHAMRLQMKAQRR